MMIERNKYSTMLWEVICNLRIDDNASELIADFSCDALMLVRHASFNQRATCGD